MTKPQKFTIDLTKEFARLPNAPIVEAVIQWQAATTKSLDATELQSELAMRFPDFSLHTQHRLEAGVKGTSSGVELHQRSHWDGFRMTSKDDKYVCQWKADTLVFSRLAPYEDWESFMTAATPFWNAFQTMSATVSLERLGVRFISQIALKSGEKISDYVKRVPPPLKGLGLRSKSFFHQDTIPIGDYPYEVRLVRVLQPAQPPMSPETSLIVDIDVSTTEATSMDSVEFRLNEMRFLKNAVFFAFMHDAEQKFR